MLIGETRVGSIVVCVQILEALDYLHGHGIVHGHLHSSHVMWFSEDFCWKLVSLGYAGRAEELSIPCRCGSPYDPPELTRALMRHPRHISLERSMDMWSFGMLAFEILNRKLSGGYMAVLTTRSAHRLFRLGSRSRSRRRDPSLVWMALRSLPLGRGLLQRPLCRGVAGASFRQVLPA